MDEEKSFCRFCRAHWLNAMKVNRNEDREAETSYLQIRNNRSFQSWNDFICIVYNGFFPATDVRHFDSSVLKSKIQSYS